ncbi:MbeB family protein [Enterobacter hormaechei]|nr:MbeB family protein [Enterobacter hormaechei]
MNSLLTLAKDLEQKSKVQQQTTGEMLKAAFSEHEKSVRAELNESEKRISAAIHDHDRMLSSAMSQRTKGMLRMVSQTWLTIVLVSVLLIASSAGILWWQGQQILDNYTTIREQKSTQAMLSERNSGVQLTTCGEERRPLREGEPGRGTVRRGFELDDTGGEIAHDGTGKTVAERIRAATAGLLEKAGRVGERLRGMADDVWSYATGERSAERARPRT